MGVVLLDLINYESIVDFYLNEANLKYLVKLLGCFFLIKTDHKSFK